MHKRKNVKRKGWMQNDVCCMFPVWFKKQTKAKGVQLSGRGLA